MHFFNPPPLMPLLEVIRADQTRDAALELARAGRRGDGQAGDRRRRRPRLPREPLRAARSTARGCGCSRSGWPPHEQIDRICRLGGGFRMGPFELMDLVGIDVGFEVAKSFDELSFGEPRWRPSPIQARMVAAGRLGRKSGRGYYEYAEDGSYRPDDPEPPGARRRRRHAARDPRRRRRSPTACASAPGPPATSCARAARPSWSWTPGSRPAPVAARRRPAARAVRRPAASRHAASPARSASTCCRRSTTRGWSSSRGCRRPRRFACRGGRGASSRALGFLTEWVEDAPGLVLGRIVCQLVNEAAFAIGEGVGSADDVDTGLTLGLSHPRGPVAWSEAVGARPRARGARRPLGGAPRGALPRRAAAPARGGARA